MSRYELSDGKSDKFWEITVKGKSHTVTYGRIGTDGTSKTKDFATAAEAKESARKLTGAKVKKGYALVSVKAPVAVAKKAKTSTTKKAAKKVAKRSAKRSAKMSAKKPAKKATRKAAKKPAARAAKRSVKGGSTKTCSGFAPKLRMPTYGTNVGFCADGNTLIAVDSSQVFHFTAGEKEPRQYARPPTYCQGLAVSDDGRRAFVGSDKKVLIYDTETGKRQRTLVAASKRTVKCIALSPDQKRVAAGSGWVGAPTSIDIWDVDGEPVWAVTGLVDGIEALAFTPDSEKVVTFRNGALELWNIKTHKCQAWKVEGTHTWDARQLAVSPTGHVMINTRELLLTDAKGKLVFRSGKREYECAALSPDGHTIYAGQRSTLDRHQGPTWRRKAGTRKSSKEVRSLAVSRTGVIALGTDHAIEIHEGASPALRPSRPTRTAPAKASTVKGAWARIAKWVAEKTAGEVRLSKGATAKQVAATEDALGLELPDDLRQSVMLHNGADGLIGGWDLLSVKAMAREGRLMTSLARKGTFEGATGAYHSKIRSSWWNDKWIPIVSSGSGHLFCVDMDPAPGGKKGQLILFFHDDEKRLFVAESTKAWLNAIADDMEAGVYEYFNGFNHEALLKSSVGGQDTYG